MKKAILAIMLSLLMLTTAFALDYSIELVDTYGDGWNGGMVSVHVAGTAALTDLTIEDGTGPETHTFTVEPGDMVEALYTAGSWSSENEYTIYDENGEIAAASGQGGATPESITFYVPQEGAPGIPTLTAPANGLVNVATDVNLIWTLGDNTDHAILYLADNEAMTGATVVDPATAPYEAALELNTTYYWKVEAVSPTNITMSTPVWHFTTAAVAGITTVSIGDGTTSAYNYPFNFFYRNSVAETIYLAEELNIGGLMQGLSFYNTFTTDLQNMPVNVWIGETTQTDLTTYIPASQLTAVFSGTVNFPAGQNIITIDFDTPYSYGGGNLVVLTERELDTDYYSSSDKFFNTETELAARTVYWQNDSDDLDPETVTAGTTVAFMPNVDFYFIVEGMGSVSGTVTDGTNGLEGVELVIDGTNYQAVTYADGSFEFPYVAEGQDYTLTASLHGYYDGTATFDVTEDQETMVNVTMTMLPMVEVSGQVITNDTGAGIQAHVTLTGYENYEADTDAMGNFAINVFANHTYAGTAVAEGYQPGSFEAVVADADLDLGTILVTETLFPVSNVVATLDGDDALVTWNQPGTGGGGVDSFADDFEGDLSAWAEVIQGAGTPGENGQAYWYVGAPDQEYDGNCLRADWGYTIDTSVITPAIAVTAETAITFDMNTSYHWFVDPNDNGDLSIEVSADGSNWTSLWTEDDYGTFENFAWLNINIPLSDYAGQSLQVALHLTGDDNANMQVDNFFVGAARNNANFVIANPVEKINAAAKVAGVPTNNILRNRAIVRNTNSTRAFESYNVYRFLIEDADNMDNWDLVAEEISDTTFTDTDWSTLAVGFYKYAVAAVYTNGAQANAVMSNWLQNSAMAQVTVNVDSNLGDVIADANISLMAQNPNPDGEYDMYEAMTDASGTAVITVNVGMYDIDITAGGFTAYTGVVDASADVTVEVTLNEVALPPTAVVAEQIATDAVITWGEPGGAGSGEWITKGAEENNDGIGTGGAATFHYAHMYTEAELADYQGMYINSMKIFPREATATYTLKVYGGTDGNTELYSQAVTEFTNEAWNEYTLDSSVAIPAAGPLYIGYYVETSTGYPGGCDAGPAVPGGDMVKMNDQENWDVLSDITTINVNWNIQAYVSWARGGQVASEARRIIRRENTQVNNDRLVQGNLAPIVNPSVVSHRELLGYKVWRFLSIDQGNEANWTLLTDNMITDLTYTDTDWDALASGSYKFAVKANYTNDNMSPAAFSNILLKDMYGTVDGTVVAEGGAPINGASVTLDGNTVTTDASGYFIFTEVLAGVYDITASAAGYVGQTQSVTVVGTVLTSVNFTLAESNILISDGFESYPDFALEAAPWTLIDGDLSPTYGFQGVSFENTGAPMAYIVFNPAMTTPPLEEDANAAHTGTKYMACFASTTPDNNDWMITPSFTLGDSGSFNFWGKSVMDDYGLERFNVLVSNGSTNPNDFTSISGGTYVQAPITWTQYSYSLDDYANQTIRVAIQCVSSDAFIFMVDDVEIDAPGGTPNQPEIAPAVSQLIGNYPNPFNPETRITFSTKDNGPVSIDIYNVKGQKVRSLLNENREAGNHSVVWNGKDDNGKNVASGVFFYRMKSGKYSSTKKMILMK